MHRVLVIALLGCGRIAFDPLGDDAAGGLRISLELPDGGQFERVAVGPDGTWYAVSQTTGVFRSDDHVTWTPCAPRYARGIVVHTDNSVWVGGTTIAQSTDRCATWIDRPAPNGTRGENVASVRGTVYGLLPNGVVEWTGSAWNTLTPLIGVYAWAMAANSNAIILATSTGLLRSDDGVFWSAASGVPSAVYPDVTALGGLAYAISHSTATTSGGIYCTTALDASSWVECETPGGFAIMVDPAKETRAVAAVYDNMAWTDNAFGATTRDFPALMRGLDYSLVLDLETAPNGTVLLATTRGVYAASSTDFTTAVFEERFAGLAAWDIDPMLRDGDDVFLATRGGVLRSIAGAPFTVHTTGLTNNTTIRALAFTPDGTTMLVGGRHLFASKDRGQTFEMRFTTNVQDGYYVDAFEFDGDRVFVGTGARVLVGRPPYLAADFTGYQIAGADRGVPALKYVDGTLFAGTTSGLFVSTDQGMSFTMVASGFFLDLLLLADGRLLASTTDGVLISNATRAMWQPAGLAGKRVTRVREIGQLLVATSDQGVSYSRDGAATWVPVPGAELTSASDLLFDGDLVLGSNSGLVRVPLP